MLTVGTLNLPFLTIIFVVLLFVNNQILLITFVAFDLIELMEL